MGPIDPPHPPNNPMKPIYCMIGIPMGFNPGYPHLKKKYQHTSVTAGFHIWQCMDLRGHKNNGLGPTAIFVGNPPGNPMVHVWHHIPGCPFLKKYTLARPRGPGRAGPTVGGPTVGGPTMFTILYIAYL